MTLYFTLCREFRGCSGHVWLGELRPDGNEDMCVFGCLRLNWSFTTCVAVVMGVGGVGVVWRAVPAVAILVKRNLARYFERVVIMASTPVDMQSFVTVKFVFFVSAVQGEPVQALLNIMGILAALSEVLEMMQSRSGPSLRHRLKKTKRWWPGGQQS